MEKSSFTNFINENKDSWEIVVTDNLIKLSTGNTVSNINTDKLFIFFGIVLLEAEIAENDKEIFNLIKDEKKITLGLSKKDIVDHLYEIFIIRENDNLILNNDIIEKRRKIEFLKELRNHIIYI